MGPADSLSSRPGKILWIVKCSERFWYFPGSFGCASFRLCMPVSFVDDAPLSPPLVSLVGNVSCRLVPALSPAQGFLLVSRPRMFDFTCGRFCSSFRLWRFWCCCLCSLAFWFFARGCPGAWFSLSFSYTNAFISTAGLPFPFPQSKRSAAVLSPHPKR